MASFLSAIDESLEVRLFGTPVDDVRLAAGESLLARQLGGEELGVVMLHGVKSEGRCFTLPRPVLVILPGQGIQAAGCPEFPADQFQMWVLPLGSPCVILSHQVTSAGDIVNAVIRPLVDINSDFRIYNVHLDGTTLKGRVRAYLRLHQSGPFGTTLFDITVVDRDDAFSIELVPHCITVFSIGVASAQVCYYDNPRRICGEVVVGIDLPVIGHWGKTFTLACVNV